MTPAATTGAPAGVTALHPPPWVRDWIGLPYAPRGRTRGGVDCWGLVRLVLAERFGISVPAYDGLGWTGVRDSVATSALVARAKGEDWAAGWAEVPEDAAAAGDIVVLLRRGRPLHVGLIVAPGWLLHVEAGVDSVAQRLHGLGRPFRVESCWRYRGAA